MNDQGVITLMPATPNDYGKDWTHEELRQALRATITVSKYEIQRLRQRTKELKAQLLTCQDNCQYHELNEAKALERIAELEAQVKSAHSFGYNCAAADCGCPRLNQKRMEKESWDEWAELSGFDGKVETGDE